MISFYKENTFQIIVSSPKFERVFSIENQRKQFLEYFLWHVILLQSDTFVFYVREIFCNVLNHFVSLLLQFKLYFLNFYLLYWILIYNWIDFFYYCRVVASCCTGCYCILQGVKLFLGVLVYCTLLFSGILCKFARKTRCNSWGRMNQYKNIMCCLNIPYSWIALDFLHNMYLNIN